MKRILFALILIIGITNILYSQNVQKNQSDLILSETINFKEKKKLHSAKKATFLSIIIPGAGQVYNKKYWKTPVIWGSILISLSVSQTYRALYNDYKNEYYLQLISPSAPNKLNDYGSLNNLESQKNLFKKRMETAYIFAGAIYVLQILDANVDAHLMTFDVSNDLSFTVLPSAYPNLVKPSPTMGLTLCLHLL